MFFVSWKLALVQQQGSWSPKVGNVFGRIVLPRFYKSGSSCNRMKHLELELRTRLAYESFVGFRFFFLFPNKVIDLLNVCMLYMAVCNSICICYSFTGGIASGKSSIANRLQKLGAHIIDCDKLGHKAYEPGTATFDKVVQRFGGDIVSRAGTIDRKILAAKVFSNAASDASSPLDDLNRIVWPEIERLARNEISAVAGDDRSAAESISVCVLDAAVLLEVRNRRVCCRRK